MANSTLDTLDLWYWDTQEKRDVQPPSPRCPDSLRESGWERGYINGEVDILHQCTCENSVGWATYSLAHSLLGFGPIKIISSVKPLPHIVGSQKFSKSIPPRPQGKLPEHRSTFAPSLTHLFIMFLHSLEFSMKSIFTFPALEGKGPTEVSGVGNRFPAKMAERQDHERTSPCSYNKTTATCPPAIKKTDWSLAEVSGLE